MSKFTQRPGILVLMSCVLLMVLTSVPASLSLGASFKLEPVAGTESAGGQIVYELKGQELEDAGSLEVTLHYPAQDMQTPEVVFDPTLIGGSALSQANTSSPGIIRLGILDATGLQFAEGQTLARIQFEQNPSRTSSRNVEPFVRLTDLKGNPMQASIESQNPALGATEEQREESGNAQFKSLQTRAKQERHPYLDQSPDMQPEQDKYPKGRSFTGRGHEAKAFQKRMFSDMKKADPYLRAVESGSAPSPQYELKLADRNGSPQVDVFFEKQTYQGNLYRVVFHDQQVNFALINARQRKRHIVNEQTIVYVEAFQNAKLAILKSELRLVSLNEASVLMQSKE